MAEAMSWQLVEAWSRPRKQVPVMLLLLDAMVLTQPMPVGWEQVLP
jgi:hypothetical protein